ncbi:MAG: hypothetical protein ACKN9V_09155, partial [Pseudomonadota bacterium]
KTEAQIKAQLEESVPLDLKAIAIDELILRVNAAPKREVFVTKFSEEREKYQSVNSSSSSVSSSSKMISALFGLLAVMGILYAGFKEFIPSTKETAREIAEDKKVQPGIEATGLPKARSGSEPKKPVASPAPSLAPKERDRGEVREDELVRMREEERRREAAEREREKAQREAEEARGDQEETSAEAEGEADADAEAESGKKNNQRPKKPRRPTNEPSESEEDETPPPSWLE